MTRRGLSAGREVNGKPGTVSSVREGSGGIEGWMSEVRKVRAQKEEGPGTESLKPALPCAYDELFV